MRPKRSSTVKYHDGELTAQDNAGFRADAKRLESIINDTIPRGANGYLGSLNQLIVGASDAEGNLWASALYGQPGFLTVPDRDTLLVAARPAVADPLASALSQPSHIGTLAIDFTTRRRFRINGRSTPTPDGLRISVDQAYGNCPQYIQQRTPEDSTPGGEAALTASGTAMTQEQQVIITESDTFFVASASAVGDADVSHRGGNPGFIRILGPNRLQWPDYAGNKMLMTLGNLTQNPAAGLLFIDWGNGNSLHLTGTAETDWDEAKSARLPGADRSVVFTVERTVQVSHAEAPGWTPPSFSRFNPPVA